CNVINGDVVLDYERTGGIQFENIISTRKMGYNINRETALLIALEETVAMRQAGKSSIELLDKKGNIVAKLSRLDLKKQ
ncbi:MAG: META domain-containing protein, partial [Muribaculaceae bacterium]|nr:META domain-containing protein [Muribaculaceae bacterium]